MRSTKEFTRRVFAYINQVNRDKELPSAAVRVGLVIADHWNEESGEAHPSLQTIALESGLGDGTVRRMLPALVERGHLAVQVGSRGSGHPNHYQPLEKSAKGGVIKSANGGAIKEKPKAPFTGIKAPSETNKAPTGALNTVEHTEHSKSAPSARSTARVDRRNVTETEKATDDATPNQRADALVENVKAQQQLPSVAAQEPQPPRNNPIGAAANGAHADADVERQFHFVRSTWPGVRVDEGKAHEVFLRVMASGQSLQAVIDAVGQTLMAPGDVPWLSEALTLFERRQARNIRR